MKKHSNLNELRRYSIAFRKEDYDLVYRKKKEDAIKFAKAYLSDRFEHRRTPGTNAYVNEGFSLDKKRYGAEDLSKKLNLNPQKPTVFLMCHAFSDNPHCDDRMIHNDYFEWLEDTLDIVANIQHVNWIVRPHPEDKYYRSKENYAVLAAEKYVEKYDHIFHCPEDLNTSSLSEIADALVTVRGTCALEFSAIGIPCVVTGKCSFTGFGLTIEPETREEYIEVLQNIHTYGRLSQERIDKALTCCYCYFYLDKVESAFLPSVPSNWWSPFNKEKFWQDALSAIKTHSVNDDPVYRNFNIQLQRDLPHLMRFDKLPDSGVRQSSKTHNVEDQNSDFLANRVAGIVKAEVPNCLIRGPDQKTMEWRNLSILVTGGTGSFGKKFVEIMLHDFHPKKIIIFSRDELKQHEMRMSGLDDSSLRYFIGDVRERNRLQRAMDGVDIVIHAAALKQVPSCEYNPFEAVKTNIDGAQNVIDAGIDVGVNKVIALSTDKAVNPINLYGATKLCAEKLFIQGNAYSGPRGTRFSCVRYGNVIGSRGSVIPVFMNQKKNGKITITDKRMTRFWITLDQAVELVINALCLMQGGEIFVPKIPSMKIMDLAQALAPECDFDVIGIRPGEKLHELLITEEEGRNTVAYNGMYVIMPNYSWWRRENHEGGQRLPEGFVYTSNKNDEWLTVEDLKKIIYGSSSFVEDPTSRLLSTIHELNEKIILNVLNSEESIPQTSSAVHR